MENINLNSIRKSDTKLVKGLRQRLHDLDEQQAFLDQVDINELLQQRRRSTHSYDRYGHDAFCRHQRRSRENRTQEEYIKKMIKAARRGDYRALQNLQDQLRVQLDEFRKDDFK